MASLKDQLLKAGMVNAQKAKQVETEKRKQAKQTRKGGQQQVDEAKQLAEQAKAEKRAKDREISRQQKLQAEEKAIAAQIKQMIESHRIAREKADVAFQFVDGTKIKKLYVDAKQLLQLEKGIIAVVRFNDSYELVATAIAEKIQQRDGDTVVVLNSRAQASDNPKDDEDDPYADYKVPDDLMW
jgi:uncharacterized protein YaiL (DUF2058 family)